MCNNYFSHVWWTFKPYNLDDRKFSRVLVISPGRSTRQLVRQDLHQVATLRPDVCVLLIGGNDIRTDIDPATEESARQAEEIALHILSVASLLHVRYGVSAVIICQLMPRFPKYWICTVQTVRSCLAYNAQALTVNGTIEREVASNGCITLFRNNS